MAFGRIGDLINVNYNDKPLVVTNCLCLFFKFNHDAGWLITAFCPFWLAAERLCATMMIKTYAEKTANVGIWLAAGTVRKLLTSWKFEKLKKFSNKKLIKFM